LCIAYLLDSLSEAGNEPIEEMTAYGLNLALQRYASDVPRYLKPKAAADPEEPSANRRPSIVLKPLEQTHGS
jgi:hypothetical protein